MDVSFRAIAFIAGILGVFLYFRSIVRVMLLNRRERDFVEFGARFAAVHIVHALAGDGRDYDRVQRMQAWVLPLFIFISVTSWPCWPISSQPSWKVRKARPATKP